MKKSSPIITAFAVFALAVCLSSNNLAQNREKFTISAKAGGVNSVMGNVMVTRAGLSAELLTSQDNLAAGDVVKLEPDVAKAFPTAKAVNAAPTRSATPCATSSAASYSSEARPRPAANRSSPDA